MRLKLATSYLLTKLCKTFEHRPVVNEVVVSARAKRDLTDIYTFISNDSPQAAGGVIDRLVSIFRQLADGELNGPEVMFENGRRARRWPFPPYRIYYRRTRNRTVILRVYHGARWPIE
jgi:plasmid stabilization system protein ParE